jgi:probable phosphoglycerate mutase
MTCEQALTSTVTPANGTLFLLRHGEVQIADTGRHYIGQQDLPLSPRGREQATAWGDYFAAAGLQSIVCSDLSRCAETARIIGARCRLVPQARPELREVDLGGWDGQSFAAIQSRDPEAFRQRGARIADHCPPGGESFRDLDGRVWPFFEALLHRPQGRILVVTHAGVIRVLLCRLLGIPLENLFALGVAHGALTWVDIRPAGNRLQALNLTPQSENPILP